MAQANIFLLSRMLDSSQIFTDQKRKQFLKKSSFIQKRTQNGERVLMISQAEEFVPD